MRSCLAILHNARGIHDGITVEKNKKKSVIWALTASVCVIAMAVFATLTFVGASLAITAFVTGAGTALGVFQLFNTITNLFLFAVLGYVMSNCIKNAHYHLHGKRVIELPTPNIVVNDSMRDIKKTL